MNQKRFQEIFTDEAFVWSLFELTRAEEVQLSLSEKGLVLSLDEIEALRRQILVQNGELDDEELDRVAGGLAIPIDFILPPITGPGSIMRPPLPKPRW